jgi:hypothetical protein
VARRRPPPGRRPPGRRPPPREEIEEELPPQPPIWERIILSKTFRLVVGTTFAAAAIAVLIFLIGPANISRTVGAAAQFAARQSGRVGGLASVAIASSIQEEGRKLWVETKTPLPTPTVTATPLPSPTEFPTPPPPRRAVDLPPTPPSKPLKPGDPLSKPSPGPQLPFDAAVNSQREYLEIVSTGDVRRALQYWAPDANPEARSALDAAIARGDKYTVKAANLRPLPTGAEITVDMDVTDKDGKTLPVQHRYQWRFFENQWFITARLQ